MKGAELARQASDKLRTAPVGLATAAAGIVPLAAEFFVEKLGALENPTTYLSLPIIAMGALKTQIALDHRARLENAITKRGYSDKLLDYSTVRYCHRQMARVVCENAGYLEEYEELCERNREVQRYPWLPHF